MYKRTYPHLYRGVVESNIDPEHLGRCKVRVPSIHGSMKGNLLEALPWARPLALSPVHTSRGSVQLPDVGDIVWVLFEESLREYPIYFGGTYGKGELIIDPNVVEFYLEEDTRISYDRVGRTYDIQIGNNHVQLSPAGISIIGDTSIEGNLIVRGTITVDDLIINNSCSRECDCT